MTRVVGFSRRLTVTMSLLVLGTAAALVVSGWFLLVDPSVTSVAHSRIQHAGVVLDKTLRHLFSQTERLLGDAELWVSDEGIPIELKALNRRFMPVLRQHPAVSLVLIAEPSGKEWMLMKRKDGTWENQLTPAADGRERGARFLTWRNAEDLIDEEWRPSDYDPRQRPWFRLAAAAPLGETVWTPIYRFYDDGHPGVTAAMRVAKPGDPDDWLVVAIDLRLVDIAPALAEVEIGQRSLAVLLTDGAHVLGMTRSASLANALPLEDMILKPVATVHHGPMTAGVSYWMQSGQGPIENAQFLYEGDLWHLGFRRLALGEQPLWLGVFLPVAELIPGLAFQLTVLAAVLLAAIAMVVLLAVRLTRSFSKPLERLAENSRRIGDLNFEPSPPVNSDIREIRQLATAQDEMRGMLKASHDELTEEHRALLRAQEKLIQAAKMESVGRLAAGVAHEVKNPLAIVQLGVDYLSEGRDIDATSRQVLADMEDAVTRADQVIKGLLDFSRERQLDLRPSELSAIIRESLHLVEHELNQRGIEVDLDLRAIPTLSLDADKLRQVFVNLFMNAVQAMGTEGTLSVRIAEVVLDDPAQLKRFSAGGFAAGEAVALVEVMDTGPGISKAQQSHLFEPFFTTKAVGDGTGLGLSVSKTIVEMHQGAIDIGNREPRGASVVLVFPIKQPSGGSDEQDQGLSGR